MRAIVQPPIDADTSSDESDPMADEPCSYQAVDNAPVSIFDNYKWRGLQLASLSLFEYCMLTQSKKVQDVTAIDVEFDPSHPKSHTHLQRLVRNKSQMATVTLIGQLSEFQEAEDSVRGGHPATEAIVNDLAEVLLGLFIPRQQLPALFQEYATGVLTKRDACARIWAVVEPTLTPYLQNFARNIELLRKSKEDCQLDAKLRGSDGADDSFDLDIDQLDDANMDFRDEEVFQSTDDTLDAETLITAYHSIARKLETREGSNTAANPGIHF